MGYNTEGNEVARIENLTVDSGETVSKTFTYNIGENESIGDYSIWVKSVDDTDSTVISVLEATPIISEVTVSGVKQVTSALMALIGVGVGVAVVLIILKILL